MTALGDPEARPLVVLVCGAILTGCVAAWVVSGEQTTRVASHLGVFGLAFAAYLAALAAAPGLKTRGLALALGLAVLWRLALVLGPPLLSDDVYRYVWEGRIQLQGGNPFLWSDRPEAPRWLSLRDGVWAGINHKDYTAVYPPLWQLAARAVVACSDSVTAMKSLVAACECLTLWPLAALLKRRGQPLGRLLVLAWSPLALVETAGSGHNDALGVLLLTASLAALSAHRPWVSALAFGLGFQAKFLPGLVALSWARRYRLVHGLLALGAASVLVWPYASAGSGLLLSLGKYSRFWRFNETLFASLSWLTGSQGGGVRLSGLVVLTLALALAWRRVEAAVAGLTVVSAWLLLAPNVLPWYALWLLPFLVLCEAPWALLFTGTVQLAYLVYPGWLAGEPWHLGWGIRALEYAPCGLVGLKSLWEARR